MPPYRDRHAPSHRAHLGQTEALETSDQVALLVLIREQAFDGLETGSGGPLEAIQERHLSEQGRQIRSELHH